MLAENRLIDTIFRGDFYRYAITDMDFKWATATTVYQASTVLDGLFPLASPISVAVALNGRVIELAAAAAPVTAADCFINFRLLNK